MIPTSVVVLVLGALALVIAGVALIAWLNGRVHTRAMAQLEEGYRQALCASDELSNKAMALVDARAQALYRQAAGVMAKPPAVKSHATAGDKPGVQPAPRIDAASIADAEKRIEELQEAHRKNGGPVISAPGDYGSGQREPGQE